MQREFTRRLLDYIYSKNRYQHLSMIFARPEERLCIYVKASISSYLDVVLEKAVRIRDNAEVIDWVLASKEASPEQKKAYAGRLDGGTTDIDRFKRSHTGQGVAF